ncbi:hypothetical protein AcV5_009313 [Taiwanofungus camphoratus]|nr:hypothetical protein AcV5_009313 [Antrodia cinnamomea]KAI0924673.1 hypothetical protein AcW2_005489 [Antrodia cinnamomea]
MTMFRTVRRSLPVQYPRQSLRATFSTFPALLAHRAIVYTQTGNPSSVLTALTYPPLPPPPHDALNIRFRLSPINPSDLNVIEGVYPAKPAPVSALSPGHQLPEPVCVAGNEGLAEVLEVGSGVEGLSKGDWVVMAKQQAGTWSTTRTVESGDVVKLPSGSVSEVNGATMTVCALAICRTNCSSHSRCKGESADGVQYAEGLCGTQRGRLVSAKRCVHLSLRRSALMSSYIPIAGANSAVGQAVIQIAARRGLRTLNFVRNRPDLEALKEQLRGLGATHVFTYDDLADKAFLKSARELTGGKPIRLMLNCVSGQPTTQMTRLLGADAHVVSYGAMSKQPLSLPTSAFIFKNLTAHGFWQTRWYEAHSREEREAMMRTLAGLKLKEPAHEIVTLEGRLSDEEVGRKVRDVIARIGEGKYGRKVLLRIEDPE